MGYRSEVMAVFYCHRPEDYAPMKLFIDENIKSQWVKECFKEDEKTNGKDKYILFQAYDVKWYDTYKDVIEFNEMVKRFKKLADGDGSELTWAYEFVRIGEDTNDIESDESDGADNVLNISRVVDINI